MTVITAPAAPPATKMRIGLLKGIRERLFGAKLDDIKIEDHTRVILRIGQWLAPWLIVVFSLAFSVQLTGEAAARLLAFFLGHGTFQIADAINFLAVNFGVVGLDISMIVAFVKIRDEIARKHGPGHWWGYATWGSLVILLEAGTFFALLVSSEKPTLWYEWASIAGRAIMTPGCAVFLTVTPPRVLTEDEMILHVTRKVAAALAESLEAMTISAQAEFGKLMELFLHLILRDPALPVDTFMTRMQDLLKNISPSAAQEQYEAAIREMERRIDAAERGANDAETRAYALVRDALYGAFVAHEFPDHVLEAMPDLASIALPDVTQGPGKAKALPPPRDDLRGQAQAAGVAFVRGYKDAKGTAKKPYGPWIRAAYIPTFALEDSVSADEAKAIAKLVGDGAKEGTAYCAPVKGVLAELKRISKLDPKWERFIVATDSTEDAA